MSKLVVDTNVILSSFISAGPPRLIVNRIRDRLDLLCVSPPILDEYLVVLQRAGLSADLLASLFSLFQDPDRILLAFPSRRLHVIRDDPSDNMFIECAVETSADYLISGDQHLKRLKSFQGIQIVSPREYLSRLREE
ncbi:MAG: putative toxin-antitoxin system toxin component, PIN family [candidate division NC10 bacterium]|nr:putative toxin-antitoxin system toxin component, PIN family [candidate division NC10 bacterium]